MTTQPFRVLIADSMSPRAAETLAACDRIEVHDRAGISADELKTAIADYHGLLVRSRTKVTAEVIAAGERLVIIGRAGIGVDNIDLKAASRRGIVVENAPSGNSVTTAEHALCLLCSLARNIPQATASLKAGKWEKKKLSGSEILGKNLGIIGLGNIGRIAANRAQGLHMNVIAYDPFIGAEAAERLGVELVTLDDLFARADFITVHTPLTTQTRGIIDGAAIAKMKDGVLIVNAARGGIVDEEALLAGLDSGKVGGAALDVFSQEPPPADHPLVAHPKVICTPHLGASTSEAQHKVAIEVAGQIVDFVDKGEIRNAVNLSSVPAEALQLIGPWLELARHLGSFLAQMESKDDGFMDEITVEVFGEPCELGPTACTRATLVGLLQHFMDVPINEVNASLVAAERRLLVNEVKRAQDRDLQSAIAVSARSGDTTRYVKGTLYHVGERVEPRLVQIDGFLVEMPPTGRILAVLNQDRPGVIGKVGTLLGEREINVSSLHVGLDSEREVAIALWSVDADIPGPLVEAVRGLPFVSRVQVIEL